MKIGFIGGGNMAAALIGGLRRQEFPPGDLAVAEPLAARRDWLESEYAVRIAENAAGLPPCDMLVLAVKPQQLREVLAALPPLPATTCILSVAAGIRAADISRWLGGHGAVARAMPNTPALVGAGITGLYALPGVSPEQRRAAEDILAAVGQVVWVDNEAMIDAVTAISGSGPAYVFYFIEALEEAAMELGLPPGTARRLSLHTFLGAATLAVRDGGEPAELRARVTSKGGTTERGIAALEQGEVKAIVQRAAQAAALRAREMGDQLGGVA